MHNNEIYKKDTKEVMRKYTFGKLLYRFRKERRLEMNKICEGLCSESTLKLFEKEKNIPDILLFERMLERMGVSPEDVSLMVREEDYGYHAWQEQVCEAIQNGKWEELNMLLHSKAGTGIYCNERLEKQFFAYADGVRKGVNKEYGKAVQLLSYAAKQTMPDIFEMLEKNVLLSTLEIHILILYLYYGIMVLWGMCWKRMKEKHYLLP